MTRLKGWSVKYFNHSASCVQIASKEAPGAAVSLLPHKAFIQRAKADGSCRIRERAAVVKHRNEATGSQRSIEVVLIHILISPRLLFFPYSSEISGMGPEHSDEIQMYLASMFQPHTGSLFTRNWKFLSFKWIPGAAWLKPFLFIRTACPFSRLLWIEQLWLINSGFLPLCVAFNQGLTAGFYRWSSCIMHRKLLTNL